MNKTTATFFEANAGTGKTRTLTEHILDAVKKGISPDKICALTFTDKAANEMLDRLRSGVAGLVSKGDLDASQMQMAGKCFIGTIHSFCLQLVKRFAPEVPLPPIFDIDPQEERFQALFENRWDEFLSQLLASPAPADQAIIQSLGVTTLRALAEQLVKTRHDFQLENEDLRWLVEDLANTKKWGFRKNTLGEFVSRLVKDFELHRPVLSAMVQMRKLKAPYHGPVKDLLACKSVDLHNAVALIRQNFVKPFLLEYHASGYVLYDDLLRFAHTLLMDRRIRSEMKERYDLVLVDEMQDTDAVQYEIILYLCEKKDLHQNLTLREVHEGAGKFELEPEKLFVVGDPKQSIYGFRNADLSAYESVKTVLKNSGAEVRPLTGNYRSCANLVEFSNVLASNLFPEMRPHDSIAARPEFCREKKLDECVHFVRIYSPDNERLHLRILSEANWIARKICQLVDSGEAKFGDFGVLLRKLVHSHLYVDALSAQDIPVIIEGERFFYRSQEVIDFINLLKFTVDEKDDVALAGMLRSPLFGMTDREVALFFHKRSAGILPALGAAGFQPATSHLMERIFEIRKQIHLLSPASMIDLVLKKLPVLTVAGLAYGSYRSTLAPLNILRIHRYAVELETDPAFNLFHFVSVLTEFSREGKERGQEPLADEGLDAVRMMSIHNSKGLDFPVVFVPLTDYEIRRSANVPTEIVHDWATGASGLKINWATEANYLKLKYRDGSYSTEEPVLDDEEKRVLYVAATRAKKEIYFCCLENGSGKEVLQLLQNVNPFMQVKEEASSSALQPADKTAPHYQPLEPVLEEWKKVQDASLLRSEVQVDSVTNEAEKLEPGEEELAIIAARAKRSGGTLVGLLCHGALEKWDFQQAGDLDHLLRIEKGKYSRNFSKNQIDHAAEASSQILQGFVDSAAARWLSNIDIVGREVPIVYFDRQSRKTLSGKIDLLVKDGDKHLIVDYKTDISLTEPMRKRYAEQMRLYALALAEMVPGPLLSRLLLVRTGEIVDL
ncbi:UvrD-helicase domain-containing protein [bacterium]|nr:UvrD-helicase domain-containing protein [bacterium]